MKKQIWHLEVGYKWRNIRMVKGIETPTKEFKLGFILHLVYLSNTTGEASVS
mgnify:CR=1 FL=1